MWWRDLFVTASTKKGSKGKTEEQKNLKDSLNTYRKCKTILKCKERRTLEYKYMEDSREYCS